MELSVQFRTENALTLGLRPRYSFNRGPGVPHSLSGRFWEETNFFYWTLIFTCIANIFSEFNKQEATFLKFIYFCKTLYMFQTGFSSIIRISKLHIQRQVFVRPLLLPAASRPALQQVTVLVWQITDAVMCSFVLLIMDGKPVWNM